MINKIFIDKRGFIAIFLLTLQAIIKSSKRDTNR